MLREDRRVRQGAAASLRPATEQGSTCWPPGWPTSQNPTCGFAWGSRCWRARSDAAAPGILDSVATKALGDREDLALVGLHLAGFVGSPAAVDRLRAAAADPRLATASAVTALGATQQPGVPTPS